MRTQEMFSTRSSPLIKAYGNSKKKGICKQYKKSCFSCHIKTKIFRPSSSREFCSFASCYDPINYTAMTDESSGLRQTLKQWLLFFWCFRTRQYFRQSVINSVGIDCFIGRVILILARRGESIECQ